MCLLGALHKLRRWLGTGKASGLGLLELGWTLAGKASGLRCEAGLLLLEERRVLLELRSLAWKLGLVLAWKLLLLLELRRISGLHGILEARLALAPLCHRGWRKRSMFSIIYGT